MDIESQTPPATAERAPQLQSIIRELEKNPANIKKATGMLRKISDKVTRLKQMASVCQQTPLLSTRVNILNVMLKACEMVDSNQQFMLEMYRWILNQIYKIRWQLEDSSQQTSQMLSSMNGLIKIVYDMFSRCNQTVKGGEQTTSALYKFSASIVDAENAQKFRSLANVIFSLNLFAKIDNLELLEAHNQLVVKTYLEQIEPLFPQEQNLQEIVVSTLVKWMGRYVEFKPYFSKIIAASSFSTQLTALNKYQLEQCLLGVLDKCACSQEDQLEVIGALLEKYFSCCSGQMRDSLAYFWISNCYHLMEVRGIINISFYICGFTQQILINLIRVINKQFNQDPMRFERTLLMVIWRFLLIESRLKEYLMNHKNEAISIKLIIYKYLREVLHITQQHSLNNNQQYLTMEVYSHFFQFLLQQSEYQELRDKAVHLYILQYHQLLRPAMLRKKQITVNAVSAEGSEDLESFDQGYIQQFLRISSQEGRSLFGSLSQVRKELGVLLVRYLCSRSIFEFMNVFSSQQLFGYLVEHNIEVHADKLDHLFYQNISSNLEKTIFLLRDYGGRNIYQKRVNSYILDLLLNQTASSSRVKLVPVSFQSIVYIAQRLEGLLSILSQRNQSAINFIICIYKITSRALYNHIPDAIYMLLMTADQFQSTLSYASEAQKKQERERKLILVGHLLEYCNQNQTQDSNRLLGYASIFLIVYGEPSGQGKNEISHFEAVFEKNRFFLTWLQRILQKEYLASQTHLGYTRKREEMESRRYQQFWKAFRKSFLFGMMKHTVHVAQQGSRHFCDQINRIRCLIQSWLTCGLSQMAESEPRSNFPRKRGLVAESGQEEYESRDHQRSIQEKNVPQLVKQQDSFIDNLMRRVCNFDEIKCFREMEAYLSSLPYLSNLSMDMKQIIGLQLVDGKRRKIVHVKKCANNEGSYRDAKENG